MIDLDDLRKRPAEYQQACVDKGIKISIDEFLKTDSEYRTLLTQFEQVRAEQNKLSKNLPRLSEAEKQESLDIMKGLSQQVKNLGSALREVEEKWRTGQLLLPTIPLANVPRGKDDSENVEIRKWGTPRSLEETPEDHVSIGKRLKIIDIERGVKIAGARNYFLVGNGARLQHAILQLGLNMLWRRGYTMMEVPHIVLHETMVGTGYFPGGEEQAFALDSRDEGKHLIGTSEVSVCAFHQDELLAESELPKRYVGCSPCYRREAGSYGRDTHGLYRVHQFYKVEQVIICKADQQESARMHAEILGNAEELLKLLEIPYRVVEVCTGDMGQGQFYKNDIESWMPSRKSYGETHSCSTFYDFQARRLRLRYKTDTGENIYCHTLNNTLVASPRILIAFLENHQQSDGSIRIPEALKPFYGEDRIA
jgi:seryl-tRNA synthetase